VTQSRAGSEAIATSAATIVAVVYAVSGPRTLLVAPSALGAGDPGSTRLVYAMIVGLVAIGIGLIVLGVWLVRRTRQDPEVLAPLDRMGERTWRRSDPAAQRRLLDEVRPDGAEPLESSAPQPTLDAEFDRPNRPPAPLDDLGPGLPGDQGTTSADLPAPNQEADAET
jgi:hypothetical protein